MRDERSIAREESESIDGRGEQCAARRIVKVAAVTYRGPVHIVFEQTIWLLCDDQKESGEATLKVNKLARTRYGYIALWISATQLPRSLIWLLKFLENWELLSVPRTRNIPAAAQALPAQH